MNRSPIDSSLRRGFSTKRVRMWTCNAGGQRLITRSSAWKTQPKPCSLCLGQLDARTLRLFYCGKRSAKVCSPVKTASECGSLPNKLNCSARTFTYRPITAMNREVVPRGNCLGEADAHQALA